MCEFKPYSVPSTVFYGTEPKPCTNKSIIRHASQDNVMEKMHRSYPFKYLRVESPSSVWKVFCKQKDAILFAKKKMNGVMPFVFQSFPHGERSFLVAHPKVFWFHDCQKGLRCSYEIICEHSLCKLYFDLEFCKKTNPEKNGIRMTETFIKIVSYFISKEWKLKCTRKQILDLDSSTDEKFSRHLVYQLEYAFQDNYHVGSFVKMVCHNLRQFCEQDSKQELMEIGINIEEFNELFVNDKGKLKLFCDESVYTKNRHFRLYCSTKWNRRAYLKRSNQNEWLVHCEDDDEKIFLDSLVTYFPEAARLTILQFSTSLPKAVTNKVSDYCQTVFTHENRKESPYPQVDNFIRHLVAPGRVYRWRYASSKKCIYYDIVGNRYCRNVGREHRSNNIRLVVDINLRCFYQKCHDPDCSHFQSEPFMLPVDLLFSLEGPLVLDSSKDNEELWAGSISEDDLELLNCIESCAFSI